MPTLAIMTDYDVERPPEPAESGDPEGALDHYIRSLRAPRVLTKEETLDLARRMDSARAEFVDEMAAIPGTGVKLVERWHARRGAGLVTAALSARYRDRNARDCGARIDRALRGVERLLEGQAPDEEIARAIARADIAFEILHEIYGEMAALRGAPHNSARRRARRRLGLHEPRHRASLDRAQRALERMDREKQVFVLHNLRLVIRQAKRFRNMGVPYLDLIQEGNLGLIRAVEKFDHRLGYRFSTYAVWWIEQSLVRAVQNASRTVRVPAHVYDLAIRLRKVRERLRTRLGRAPTSEELAEAAGVSPREVVWATESLQATTSTQAALPGTEGFTLEDVLADEDAAEPIDAVERSDYAARLSRTLDSLDRRERYIVEAHYGLAGEGPLTLQEIGNRMNLSRERVRQLEARALARLRSEAEADGLGEVLGIPEPQRG